MFDHDAAVAIRRPGASKRIMRVTRHATMTLALGSLLLTGACKRAEEMPEGSETVAAMRAAEAPASPDAARDGGEQLDDHHFHVRRRPAAALGKAVGELLHHEEAEAVVIAGPPVEIVGNAGQGKRQDRPALAAIGAAAFEFEDRFGEFSHRPCATLRGHTANSWLSSFCNAAST